MQGWIAAAREARGEISRMVLSGREQLTIEGHSGLFSYDTKRIRVRIGEGMIEVTGQNLVIEYFGLRDLMIRGTIEGLRLEGEMG